MKVSYSSSESMKTRTATYGNPSSTPASKSSLSTTATAAPAAATSSSTTTTKTVSPRNSRWIAEQPISPLALPNNSNISSTTHQSILRPPSSTKLLSFSPLSENANNNIVENGQANADAVDQYQPSRTRIAAVSPVRVLQPLKLKKPAPFAPPSATSRNMAARSQKQQLQQQQSMDDYASEQQDKMFDEINVSSNAAARNESFNTTTSASLPVNSIEYRSSSTFKQKPYVTPAKAEWSNVTGDIIVTKNLKSPHPPHPTPPGDISSAFSAQHQTTTTTVEKTRTIPMTILNGNITSGGASDTPSRRSSRNISPQQQNFTTRATTPTPAPRSVSPYMAKIRYLPSSKSDDEILDRVEQQQQRRQDNTPLLATANENRKSTGSSKYEINRSIPVQILPDAERAHSRAQYMAGSEHGKPVACDLCATDPNGDDAIVRRHRNHHQHAKTPDESPSQEFPPGFLLTQNEFDYRNSQAYHSFWRNLSGLYCIMLIVLGICLPIADSTAIKIKAKYYMAYYIYLYTVSIIFLLIMLVLLVAVRRRKNNSNNSASNRLLSAHPELSDEQWEKDARNNRKSTTFAEPNTMDKNILHKVANATASDSSIDHIPHTSMTSDHTGSFYLRLGAVLFGLLALILTCFQLGQFFEHYVGDADPPPSSPSRTSTTDMPGLNRIDENVDNEVLILSVLSASVGRESCKQLLALLTPAANFLFIFIQTYFVFVNHKIRIDRCTTMVRFGLMHLVGTNLCIWLHVLIEESKHAMEHYAVEIISGKPHFYSQRNFLNSSIANQVETDNFDWFARYIKHEGEDRSPMVSTYCRNSTVMGRLQQSATPFLFPFVVEYTMICAATLYVMWDQMGIDPIKKRYFATVDLARMLPFRRSRRQHYKVTEKISVDVTGVSRGLFLGLLFFVGTVVSLVLFFVWIRLPTYERTALLQVNIVEIAIYAVCIIAVVIAMMKMRRFKYDFNVGSSLGDLLLNISQFGVYIITFFTMISGFQMIFLVDEWHIQLLAMVAVVLETTQTILQTLFLLDATRRRPAHELHVRLKPARELVTFLLVCNIGIWTMKSFESWRYQLHPVQIGFYGFWTWTLVTHICSPLMIFYRFHSSVMLSEVWKKAHKYRST